MVVMVYSLFEWVMQALHHQPYDPPPKGSPQSESSGGFWADCGALAPRSTMQDRRVEFPLRAPGFRYGLGFRV